MTTRTPQTAQDSAEPPLDLLEVLESDSARKYALIESVLAGPQMFDRWYDSVELFKQAGQRCYLSRRRELIAEIAERGLVPVANERTAKNRTLFDWELRQLLTDPEALEQLHSEIWASDNPHWRKKCDAPAATLEQLPQPSPLQESFKSIQQSLKPSMAIAAALLVVVFAGGAQLVKYHQQLREYQHLYGELGLAQPVVYAIDDEHPVAYGLVLGKAQAHLIKALRITIAPGIEGEEPASLEHPVQRAADGPDAVEFRIRLPELPRDNRLRTITIEPLPHPEALAAAPDSLSPAKLTKTVYAVCRSSGIEFSPGPMDRPLVSSIAPTEPNGNRIAVRVKALSDRGYVAVAHHAAQHFFVTAPQPIQRYGQELVFDVMLAEGETFQFTAFAAEDRDDLTDDNLKGERRGVFASDAVEFGLPPRP